MMLCFLFKQKTAYEMRISDWSSDVCSSDLDARGDVLYVGKARVLRNRVANYVQWDKLPIRLQRMVSQTRSMTIVTTNAEAEALLLEAQLIKRFRQIGSAPCRERVCQYV